MPRRNISRLQMKARHLGMLRALLAQQVPQAEVWAYGSTVNLLKPDGLKIPRFALPPHELCETFDVVAAPLRLKSQANVEQMETLAALRDTLLPRLISGQLRIPDAQRIEEKAA